MSVLVKIKQDLNKVKKIDLKKLEEYGILGNLYLGLSDEACCFERYKGDNDIRNKILVLFDRDLFGRGMLLLLDNDYNIELVLNYPTTQVDIDNFYRFIKDICDKFKFKKIIEDNIEYDIKDIDKLKNGVTRANQINIKNNIEAGLTIFGCINPITLDNEFIKEIDKLSATQAVQYFGSYLERKQRKMYYFAKPLLFKKDTGKLYSRYALTENATSIFPINPYLPFGYNQKLIKDIEDWNVVVFKENNDDYLLVGEVPFNYFKKIINIKKLVKYDYKHILVTVDKKIILKVENYNIKKAKKELIAWLKGNNYKPLQVVFTNKFYDENNEICYIFKYKNNLFTSWYLGIVNKLGSYSNIKEYKKETEVEAANDILNLLKEGKDKNE